jgi:lysophospholipid acyltransferase (LPLAT)-like uncharacterized protein
MKIRNPFLAKVLGFGLAWALRLWIGSLRYRYRPLGPDVDPSRNAEGRYIFAIWHENLLQPMYRYCGLGICVLISRHADGQLLTEICRHLDIRLVRGSTTRGSVVAVRQLLRIGRDSSLAVTPDGPRGPRRRVQLGLVYLASQTGMAIVPVGFGFRRPWRCRSWDRFVLPRPLSRSTCVTAAPITVPADAKRADLESYRVRVEEALQTATKVAERWAETGSWPGRGEPESAATAVPPDETGRKSESGAA